MQTRDFLLEIGCEELPAIPLYKATEQAGTLLEDALRAHGLGFAEIKTMSTPRRIAVYVTDLDEATEAVSIEMRGPQTSIAFDAEGNPTRAAIGFARGKGADASDLVVREEDGKEYVFLTIHKPSRSAQDILSEVCSDLIGKIAWPRSQRWGRTEERFGRAVRWIVALFGDESVDVHYAGVQSSRTTRGLRVLHAEPEIATASAYESTLHDAGVVVDTTKRSELIRAGVAEIEKTHGLRADMPKKIFDEVVNLVEWPKVLMGTFDEIFLSVPHEIICESMLSHQRYFPLYDEKGNLTRNFIIVANTPLDVDATVIDGNERVVRARLYDAKFFYDEDLKVSMEDFRSRLSVVGFQEKLGSVLDKANRIEALAAEIARVAGCDTEIVELSSRAAHLCKADLVSGAVVEFTSQQGVMGGYYAQAAGEDERVCLAIKEHYRPRFAGDVVPSNEVGMCVAMADKLDTICGIFAIDEAPTGSSDPFALRRSAIGIINMIRSGMSLDLRSLIEASLQLYADQGLSFDMAATAKNVGQFIIGRMVAMAKDEGIQSDTIAAVCGVEILNPVEFFARATALDHARENDPETFTDLAAAYARASHIADASLGTEVETALLGEVEAQVFKAVLEVQSALEVHLADSQYAEALSALASLKEPVDTFFNEVLVMDSDEKIRNNRLRLLNSFARVFSNIADMGALVRKK